MYRGSEPSPAPAKRERVMASKLQGAPEVRHFFFEKITFFSNPSPIFVLRPVLTRSGSIQNREKKAQKIVRDPNKSKKPMIMIDSNPKWPFFGQTWTNRQEMPRNTSTQVGRPCMSRGSFQPNKAGHGPRYSMTSCNGPLRGPNHEWPQEDVKLNPPTPWSKTIDLWYRTIDTW